ncbi:hypothetical protein [cf. Phormidesmis sp. LEGE 11477]|uniref:hypothetical protein n=1 Tax=cf. Phormidesmis sp. LEGE 11477 TaxID=1828680 RepID=UPI001881DD94|nr:hypothetical protein [cf. Phormidesmis sp. LEGE 11477]MBE9062241.1 hypothetical protein [cf. Phormidesmis sp. LEGE 11477]
MKVPFCIPWLFVFILSLPARASLVKEAELTPSCDGEVPVTVYRGMGAVIDFTETDFVVRRAWLGDPSRLTLDTDRPMEQGGSRVVYLRAIETLDFEGLPSTSTTVLTAIVSDLDSERTCQFPISYSDGNPEYTSIRLIDGQERDGGTASPLLATVDINNVEAGINSNATTLGEDSLIVVQVRSFIDEVRSGKVQRIAAQELDIQWVLLEELERQGALINTPAYRQTISL